MENLVNDGARHRFDCLFLLLIKAVHHRHGLFELHLSYLIEAPPQGDNRGDHIEGLYPPVEALDLLLDNLLRHLRLTLSLLHIGGHNTGEVVDIVDVDIVDIIDAGVDVPRHRYIDKEHGPVLALLEHRTYLLWDNEVLGSPC